MVEIGEHVCDGHDGVCAICLDEIELPEIALVKGCEHAYWLVPILFIISLLFHEMRTHERCFYAFVPIFCLLCDTLDAVSWLGAFW